MLIGADCGVPPDAATCAGGPGRFVNENTADDPNDGLLAVTLYDPAMEFAIGAGRAAIPFTVVTVVVAGTRLAPACGAVNVTVTGAGRGVPSAPFTTATRLVEKFELICWD